jgi:hypothetical protein
MVWGRQLGRIFRNMIYRNLSERLAARRALPGPERRQAEDSETDSEGIRLCVLTGVYGPLGS